MAELYPDLKDRPVKETVCLFDVDGTLTPARGRVSVEMLKTLSELRHKCAIGFVSFVSHWNISSPPKCSMKDSLRLSLHDLTFSIGRRIRPRQARRATRHRFLTRYNHVRFLLL